MKGKSKHILIRNLIMICCTLFLVVGLVGLIISVTQKHNLDEKDFVENKNSYITNQKSISQFVLPSDTSVTMTDAISNSMATDYHLSNTYITISTPKELYEFSYYCNNSSTKDFYLKQYYKLLCNIDYSETYIENGIEVSANPFIPIAWNSTEGLFTGIFDGQGYEISNLKFIKLADVAGATTSIATEYADMQYLAMFSRNSGNIINLGLVKSSLAISVSISKLSTTGGVANLVGLNQGTVSNCFYKDLRDTIKYEIGISAFGGYQVAGLVFENEGEVSNSYIAVSNVLNYTVNDYDLIAEIIAKNSGTVENAYFYDSSISKCTSSEIVYRDNLFETNNYDSGKQLIGTYVSSTAALRTAFKNLSGWYVYESYPTAINSYLITSINTPIHRGITINDSLKATISSVNDFLYMYELFNIDDHFATDLTYEITSDISLANIPSSVYYYKRVIASTITGLTTKTSGDASVTLSGNVTSELPTIYNFNPIDPNRKVVTAGIDTYGLFPYVSGTISNLNIIPSSSTVDITGIDSTSSNTKGIGAVSGFVEKGTISNVNVYIQFNYSKNVDLGEYYLGGIAGLLGGEGSINQSTINGYINIGNYSTSVDSSSSAFTAGIAIGGAVGYVIDTYGTIDTVFNNASITVASNNANTKYQIGGIAGAAYSKDLNKLENRGTITIGSSSVTPKYSQMYVAGIVGRLLGTTEQIDDLTNQAPIDVYLAADQTTTVNMISGVLNADIVTLNSLNLLQASNTTGNLVVSTHKSNAGKYLFWAGGLTNAARIRALNTSNYLYYTDVINIYTANGFDSKLTGVYNLNYTNINSTKTLVAETTIDMSKVYSYAPVVNVINGSNTDNFVELKTVYNLKNVNFSTESTVSATTLLYGGVVKGKNVNYEDVRNEGNLTFSITNAITATLFNIYGVLEEVSAGYTATSIYNGGNITVSSNNNVLSTITNTYISGISYANRSNFTDETYDKYNPLSDDFDYSLTGTLATVINSGNILVNQEGAKKNSKNNINGNIRIAGITNVNASIISSAFNLGNITLNSYANANMRLEIGGIAAIGTGKYAQIKDCANNGTIRNINMSTNNVYLKSAGILCRNDTTESNDSYSASNTNPNSQGSIVFSINYGNVISYNKCAVSINRTAYSMPYSISAGIVATGLCNTINTVNYANVYGSEAVSGMYGTIDFSRFASEVKEERKVYVANSINYGNVYVIAHRYSPVGSPVDMDYDSLTQIELESNKSLYTEQGMILTVTLDAYYGSCIALINYGSNSNAQYLNIRYLINMNSVASMVANEINVPTTVVGATQTMYSAKQNDRYLNSGVVYSPLNNQSTVAYIGLFSSDFTFRKAIEGQLVLDIDRHPTDAFLTDYFQFVGYSKVNENLLNSIGWTAIAYNDAAQRFGENLTALTKLMAEYDSVSSTNYNSLLTNALNTETWTSNASPIILKSLLPDVLASQDLAKLKAIISYLFFDSSANNNITASLRQEVVDLMVDYIDSNKTDSELITILDGLMYPELLAKIIAESDSDYAAIKTILKNNISSLTKTQKLNLLNTYINLIDNTNYYKELFDQDIKSYYTTQKYTVLNELLNTLDTTTLGEIFTSLDNTSVSTSMALKYALDSMSDSDKRNLFIGVFYYSFGNMTSTYEDAFTSLLSQLDTNTNSDAYFTTAAASSFKTGFFGLGDSSYVDTWNAIKNDSSVQEYLLSRFGYVQDSFNNIHKGIYAKATEFRNTYQTNDRPNYATYTVNNDGSVATTFADGTTKIYVDANQNNLTTTRGKYIRNRFIFTPDSYVSDPYTYSTNGDGVETYFYGPYVNAPQVYSTTTGNSATTPTTATMWNEGGQGAPLIGFKINSNQNASGETNPTRRYVPLFVSLDENYIANLTGGSLNSTYYKFLWNDYGTGTACSQWVSQEIITTKPDNNKFVLKKDTTNGTYYESTNGNNYGTAHYYRYYTYDSNGNATAHSLTPSQTLYYNYSMVGYSTHYGDYRTGIIYKNVANDSSSWNANDVLWGYCSANIITGIYYQQDMWGQNGSFMTAKDRYGVITTHYIDYSLDDLIAVDGIRTKGLSTGASSSDEITIIKDLFDNYLLDTEAGQKVVLKAVANALKTDIYNAYANYYLGYAMYESSNTAFINAYMNNIPTTSSSYDLLYSNNSTTLSTYLNNYFTTNILPTLSQIDQIIYYTSDSRTNMKKLLKYFYDKDTGYYSYLDELSTLYTVLESFDTANYQVIYDYINNNSSKTETELANIISNATDSNINSYITDYNSANDLSTITNISYTNYSASNVSVTLANANYNGYYYSSKATSQDGTNDYSITYSALSNNTAISVVAAGSGDITIGSTTYTVNSSLNEYIFDTTSNSSITITANSGVEIYAINSYSGTAQASSVYSNFETSDWTLANGNRTIDSVSFTTYIYATTNNAQFTFKLLETPNDNSSITIYGRKYSGGNNIQPNLMYTGSRYITYTSTTNYQYDTLNINGLNLVAGSTLTFSIYGSNRGIAVYGLKVNDVVYRFADSGGTIIATRDNSIMYSVSPSENTMFKYDTSAYTLLGSANSIDGDLKSATTNTLLISTNSSASYYTYGILNTVTSTYFVNNYIKNNYSKLFGGISSYESNEIEKYIFDKQYAENIYNLDVSGVDNVTLSTARTIGKFTLNGNSTNSIVISGASTTYGSVTFSKKMTLAAGSAVNSGSISFTLPSAAKVFVVAKANTSTLGNIYVSNGSTVVGSYINSSINTYEFALAAGTYNIYSSCATDVYAVTAVLNTDLAAINTNYQNIATKGAAIIQALTNGGYTSSDYANYKSYYNYIKQMHTFDNNSNITTYYDNEVLLLAATQTTDAYLYNLFNNTVIVQILKQSGYKLNEIFGSATTTTSTGLLSYIDLATAKNIITKLANSNDELLVEAINAATLNSTTVADASTLERELVGAYVSTDFLAKLANNTLDDSYMNTIIEAISSSYDFIKNDAVSTPEFLVLMKHLDVDVATDGYGIFALASSHGIKNGTFIPDNINLISLDAKYKKLNNTSIIEVTDSNSTSWRDKTGSSTSSSYDVSNTSSVNYHIREEMKQLKLSISTTIFELDLKYNNTYNLYASESQIDSVNKTITYLVSTSYYNSLASKTSIAIANIEIAESATYTSNLGSITWVNDTTNKTLTFNNAIVITAEDTSVTSSYTIIIKGVDISYNFAYYSTTYVDSNNEVQTTTNNMNIPYYGATIKFKFTSDVFVEGFDLKNYFFIGSTNAKSSAFATPTYWKFTSGVSNNGIVDENGDAYITVDVLQSMPQGNKYFTLQFYGTSNTLRKSVQIIKNANTAALITSFGYDGNDLLSSITGSSKKAESSILFGRAFTYEELTDYTSPSFYLYKFSVSDNATVNITASKKETNGLMTYTVTYTVTAEAGGTPNVYTHTLTEVSPYSTGDVYAYLYRDGYTHTPYADKFEGQPTTGESSLTYTSGVANYAAVYFNRGFDYQYRIRYVLNNFYIVDRDSNFGASDETLDNGSSILESYAGLTVSVTKAQQPGTYAFDYVYTNTSTWTEPEVYQNAGSLSYNPTETYYVLEDDVYKTLAELGIELDEEMFEEYKNELFVLIGGGSTSYTRTYTFPTLYVIKDYAIDALVSRLTFLDESIVLGDTATVMTPAHPLIPTDSEGNVYEANYDSVGSVASHSGVEWTYKDAFEHNTGVSINTTSVKYTTDAASAAVTDYYALGTVSDSDLTYYAPTVSIDEYAQIYKYTTLTKLTNYGEDVPDKSILTDHTKRFLYVPFDYTIGNNTTTVVFLVQLEDGTNKWLNVYKNTYDGEDSSQLVYTYTTDITTFNAKESASGFTFEGKDYTISPLAGTTNSENISLYMDYIGNPAEGHFWYISYAVFSEYYLQNGITDLNSDGEDDLGAVKYYHISIIDATNTIYFNVELYAPTDFELDSVYLTIAENIYDSSNVYTSNRQISGYAIQEYEYTEVSINSENYVSGKYYIQNRDGTYSLSTSGYDSSEAYYEKGELAISKKYDAVSISSMTQAIFDAGEYYTYAEYTEATVTQGTFVSGKYYTYSDYKTVSITSSMFVPNTFYTTEDNVTYTVATSYDSKKQYYRKTPTYTVASEYEDGTQYYEKTDTYTLAENYVANTQYYKKAKTYGLVKYTLRYNLAVLPKGYFYFYLDLPTGYIAKCVTDMENQLSKQTQNISGTSTSLKDKEKGSFVPYTSILTQTVQLDVVVSKGSGADASAWAVSTSDLYTRQIEYLGNSWDE